jgi:hypothetical protein
VFAIFPIEEPERSNGKKEDCRNVSWSLRDGNHGKVDVVDSNVEVRSEPNADWSAGSYGRGEMVVG